MPRQKKSLGQLFLRDEQILQRIAKAVPTGVPVLEIGPGDGALTRELLNLGHNVTAIELDQRMVERLESRFQHNRNFNLFNEDVLNLRWADLANLGDNITVVGNLPYHLASVIIFDVFDLVRNAARPYPSEMVVMVQHEVAQRFTALPGSKVYSSLSLQAQYHGSVVYLFTVPAACFRPKPKVDGGIIHFKFHQPNEFPNIDYKAFRKVTRGSFSQRRKMMKNSIQVINDLPQGWMDLDYDFNRRPQDFTFEEYLKLTHDLETLGKSNEDS